MTPGEAYRSAQLDSDELRHYIRKFKIKSIINLRGKRAGRNWYWEELDICKQYDVRQYDLSIPANQGNAAGYFGRYVLYSAKAPSLIEDETS